MQRLKATETASESQPTDDAADIQTTPFNQGDTYRARKAQGLGKLKHIRFKGLELEPILHSSICNYISEDVGADTSWPRLQLRFAKGVLAYIRHNKFLGDLIKRPTVKVNLHSCSTPDDQVWVLMDRSRRTVESQLMRVIGDSPYVSLDVEPARRYTAFPSPSRVIQYINLYWTCYQHFNLNPFSPNPPKDTDGRREDSGRGWVRELQGRWPGVLG